ncbi:hypothetical protein [Blastomonas sp.]|uniref:hypothetical protein n=1 Tax=Blastomonas sp. TaxID=1909299 RepID=UPI003593ED13
MRVQTLAVALAIIGVLLGGVHIALTPLAYADWTIDALWFVGTGLAIVLAAAANFVRFQSSGVSSRLILATMNLAMGCYFAAAWLVLPGPQVVIGGVLFFALTICSLANPRIKAVTN